jgi:hypothetical protein
MEYIIYNFTGYENQCEVATIEKGKIQFSFYVIDLRTTLSMNGDGDAKVRIDTIQCVSYDNEDNQVPHVLSVDEILNLEIAMIDCVDWNDWMDSQRPDDDDYEERRFNSMD